MGPTSHFRRHSLRQYLRWAASDRSGWAVGEEQAQSERKEEVLSALTRIAVQIRAWLGESLATIRQHSTPLEQATTHSLEALKAYSGGSSRAFKCGTAYYRIRLCGTAIGQRKSLQDPMV